MRIERELMRGAGPAAILQLLAAGEQYAYELIKLMERQSNGVLALGQSTLYPMLYNLEAKGLVASRIETAPGSGRPRKYYRLTDKGKKRLAHERKQWEAVASAMSNLGLISGGA